MMRPPAVLLLWALPFLTALPGAAPPAHAQQAGKAEIAAVRVGLAGCYKPGCWTPVEVTLRGASRLKAGRLSLIVPDCDAVPSVVSGWANKMVPKINTNKKEAENTFKRIIIPPHRFIG